MTLRQSIFKSAALSAAVLVLAGLLAVTAGRIRVSAGSGTAAVSSGVILGDANGDGAVTIDDVTCIQRKLAEWHAIGGFNDVAADVNGSGEIDITDATLIQQWLASMETPYAIGEPIEEPTEPTTEQATTESPTDEDGWGREIFRP